MGDRTKWYPDASSRLATIDMGQKLGVAVPFLGVEARSSSNNVSKAYHYAKFHLDPSNRLATITIHQRHRQDRQRSDSIRQTILQTGAQKRL